MQKELSFQDSENALESKLVGQVIVDMEISDDDLAFLKQVFEVFVRIIKLWIQYNRSRQNMTEALARFQTMLFEDRIASTVYRRRWFTWTCLCGYTTRQVLGRYCPGCGKKIIFEKEN